VVVQKAQDHELDMKLTCVQYTFDRSKLFVYYTSETRIDFREFIKDLGRTLKARIQMIQIGVRDEAKIIGGISTCGQILCCQRFLKDLNSVTVSMAKDQALSLNTAKLSGLCGRLMCCISYESDAYKDVRSEAYKYIQNDVCKDAEVKKDFPQIGATIVTSQGQARIAAINFAKEALTLDFGDKSFKTFTMQQIKDSNVRNDE
jgi:cell fate regulator YaaT (PSP1 superfamily)